MPSVDTMTPSAPAPPRRSGIVRQLGIDTQYVLIGFPLALVTMVLCWVGFWLGIGLSIVVIGLPILVGAIYLARGFATLERLRAGPVLRQELRHPIYRRAGSGASFWRRIFRPLSDGSTCCTGSSTSSPP
jgi:hypothetical protein